VLAHIGGLPVEEALRAGPGILAGAGALAAVWRARLARGGASAPAAQGRWRGRRSAARGVTERGPAAQASVETSAP
jgi:hypothetical protein